MSAGLHWIADATRRVLEVPYPVHVHGGRNAHDDNMNSLAVAALGVSDRERQKKYFRFANLLTIKTTLLMVYPAYNAIFVTLKGTSQLAFVLLLPVIKHSLKYITVQVEREHGDFRVAFSSSVDFFDALYMTECMQSAGTLIVGAAIILVDMVLNYAAIRGLA